VFYYRYCNFHTQHSSKHAAIAAQGAPMRRASTPLFDHARASSHFAVQENTTASAADSGYIETQCLRHGTQRSSTGTASTTESGAQPCLQPR